MTRLLKTMVWGAALAAGLLWAVPGFADALPKRGAMASTEQPVQDWSWSGVFLDLGAGGQATIMNLSTSSGGETPLMGNLNGLGAWDWTGNARVGINFQPNGSPLVYGAFVGYSVGSVAVDGSISQGQMSEGISAKITPTWDAGAIVGLVGPNKSLFYGGYRYQMADFRVSGSGLSAPVFDNLCTTALNCSDHLGGHGFILGMKMPVTPALVLGVEYGFTHFDTSEISKMENTRIDLQPDVHTVMLRGTILIGPNVFGGR